LRTGRPEDRADPVARDVEGDVLEDGVGTERLRDTPQREWEACTDEAETRLVEAPVCPTDQGTQAGRWGRPSVAPYAPGP